MIDTDAIDAQLKESADRDAEEGDEARCRYKGLCGELKCEGCEDDQKA